MLRYQYSPIQDQQITNDQEDGTISFSHRNSRESQGNFSSYASKYIPYTTSFLIFFLGLLIGLYFQVLTHKISIFWTEWQSDEHLMIQVMHISDTHIDYFFNPNQSLMKGVCHSCDLLSTCPTLPKNKTEYITRLRQHGYAFGRYGCNPPHLLYQSLIKQLKSIDSNPPVIIFTGIDFNLSL